MRWQMTALTLVAIALGVAGGADATSFIIPRDELLVRQAPLIAEVSVMSASPSPAEGVPSTDYVVLVERLLKGRVAGTSIVIRVPGGIGSDGVGLAVHGAPRFHEGERLLLFLVARRDGTYAPLHLSLGAFRSRGGSVLGETRRIALRDLIAPADSSEGRLVDAPRDWAAFSDWIAALAAGDVASANYFVDTSTLELGPQPVAPEMRPIGWERLVRGRRLRWRAANLTGVSRQAFRDALETWSTAKATSVRLRPSRVEAEPARSSVRDGINDLILGDPDELVPGSFSCTVGGVAAISATWFDPGITFRFRPGVNGVAIQATEAEIVLNDGAECLLSRRGAALGRAVFAHELGHTLGLGHTSDPASPMFPVVLGRSGFERPVPGEVEALEFLYPPRAPTRAGSGVSTGD